MKQKRAPRKTPEWLSRILADPQGNPHTLSARMMSQQSQENQVDKIREHFSKDKVLEKPNKINRNIRDRG